MRPTRGGLLLGLALTASVVLVPGVGRAQAQVDTGPAAVVLLVDGATLPALLEIPEVRALARDGGAGLLVATIEPLAVLREASTPEGALATAPPRLLGPVSLSAVGAALREIAQDEPSGLVVVVGNKASPQMLATKDKLLPIALADSPEFAASGPMRTLTSDTTRRTGVVADVDIAPTIIASAARALPDDLIGSPIRFVGAPPPLHFYEKHLANRRMSVPIQTVAGVYVAVAGLFAVAVLYYRRRLSRWVKLVAAWMAISVPILAVALLAAGRLPTLSYATVVPFVVGVTIVGTVAFDALRREDVLLVPAAIGLVVLAYFVVEAILDWSAALTPFLGGSELDGGRYFGLPNVFVGLLLGASLYVAQRHRLWPGVALIVAVGFFAGLPGIGANLGGALTLFAAASLWVIVRARADLGWAKVLAIAVGIVVVGMAAVLASHEFLTATPTHGTRFVEGAGTSASGIWDTIVHRLDVGFDLIVRNPFAILPVAGVPACLYVVLRPPPSIRGSFERHPVWRDAVLVILLGSVVAYLVNDSGAAAVGLGFGLALGGMLYVPIAEDIRDPAVEVTPAHVPIATEAENMEAT